MTDTISSQKRELQWLLSRLTWPSIMVRERACAGLATLLLHPHLGDSTQTALLLWIAEQRLESIAVIGILPFLRAQMQNDEYRVPSAELMQAIHAPSILSWLLLNEFALGQNLPLVDACRHKETAPTNFSPEPFFATYVNNFLPPAYTDYVSTIEQYERISLYRQWVFEWSSLLTELGIIPNRDELDDWHRLLPGNEHYAGTDTILSEVYRSAFLRALAWAKDQGVRSEVVQFFAVRTCPIDLGLWRVLPQPKPLWWPQIGPSMGLVDTRTAHIWQQTQLLWEQTHRKLNNGTTIVAASGIIHYQEVIYNLEIFGIFQRSLGPEVPELEDIVTWYNEARDRENEGLSLDQSSPLSFGGVVAVKPPETLQCRFADWIILPAARLNIAHKAVPRWQMWRIERGIWLPAPYLSKSQLTIACELSSIVIRNNDGEIGQWLDWTDGLEETKLKDIPSKSGQMLQVHSTIIEEFAQQNTMDFCWLCQLTSYYREYKSQEFTSFQEQRLFGASYILRL